MLAVQVHLDSAVLRSAFLGNVDGPHDLDTRKNGGQESARGAVAFDEDAVDSIADADAVGKGFDVNIAGAEGDGLLNDEVDELDDGGGVVAVVADSLGRLRLGEVDGGVGELGEHGVNGLGFGLPIVSVDGLDDLLLGSQDRSDLFVEDELKFFHGGDVGGVAHDDLQYRPILRVRQHDV